MRSRRHAAHARAALLWGVGLFAVAQLGLAASLDCLWPVIGNPVYAGRAGRLLSGADGRPLVLMLGSSRTAYGLNAARMEVKLSHGRGAPVRVFNFGTLGAGPVTQLLHLRRLLDADTVPDLLLIEVLPPFFAGQLDPPPEARWLPSSTRLSEQELAFLQRFHFPVEELAQARRLSWTVPIHAHRAAILSRCLPTWLPYAERLDWAWDIDDHGWTAHPDSLPPRHYRERVQADHRHYAAALHGFRAQGAPAQALRELLEVCRRRQISTALVLMPEGSEFRSWYPPEARTQMDALLDDLTRQSGVPCIDAREWVADGGFFDAHHLRAGGATLLSDRLAREIGPLLDK